jgi:hypothetical protein
MKTKQLLMVMSIFLFGATSQAEELKRMLPQFHKVESEKGKDLTKNEAVYRFVIKHTNDRVKSAKVQYSIDGEAFEARLEDHAFEVKTTPGKHKFQIYINYRYEEMYSDSLNILGGYIDTYNVYARIATEDVMVEKPVIYLYPEQTTNCSVQVEPVGDFSFTYPSYENGWNITANPDGSIQHKGNTFNYLFWESEQKVMTQSLVSSVGFVIEKQEILEFLNNKLDIAGFNSKEKADFITFWAPRMIQHDMVFITFHQNETCDAFASLNIAPQPDHVNRFYMTWAPTDLSKTQISEQEIIPMERDGFDVLEWGGQSLSFIQSNSLAIR